MFFHHTFYTDANKEGKAGYSGKTTKIVQTSYHSVQKAELYAVILLLQDVASPLNINTDSQYVEYTVKHIYFVTLFDDGTELYELFRTLQQSLYDRHHDLCITHIQAHTSLPGPVTKANEHTDKLLAGSLLTAKAWREQTHLNRKGVPVKSRLTREQAQDVIYQSPQCTQVQSKPHTPGVNPRGLHPNELQQMDVTHIPEFGKLSYVHCSIDTYSSFRWASALSGERAYYVIQHLLEAFNVMG